MGFIRTVKEFWYGSCVDVVFAVNAWAAPLLLLPLFLTDAQGRRCVGGRTGICIFGVGVLTVLAFLITVNWRLVAPYAETYFEGLHSVFKGSFTFHLVFELHHSWVAFFYLSGLGVCTSLMLSKF